MSAEMLSLLAAAGNGLNTSNGDPDYPFLERLAAEAGFATQIQPLSRAIYVDATTTVPLADRNGSIAAPHATISAAVASAAFVDGTAILIAPGSYPENVTILPPARRNIALVAISPGTVQINPAAGNAVAYAPTGPVLAGAPARLILAGVRFAAAAGFGAVVLGTGLADTGAEVALLDSSDDSALGSLFTACREGRSVNNQSTAPQVWRSCLTAALVGGRNSDAATGVTFDWDGATLAANAPFFVGVAGGGLAILSGGSYAVITHNAQSRVTATAAVQVNTYAATLSMFDGVAPAVDYAPAVIFGGRADTRINLGTLPNTPAGLTATPVYDLRGAIVADLVVNSADTVAGGRLIDARGAEIAAASLAGGASAFTLSLRGGAILPSPLVFAANSGVDRDRVAARNVALVAGANVFTFGAGVLPGEPAFPGGVTYTFSWGQRTPVAAVVDVPVISADTDTGFTLTLGAGGAATGDILLSRTTPLARRAWVAAPLSTRPIAWFCKRCSSTGTSSPARRRAPGPSAMASATARSTRARPCIASGRKTRRGSSEGPSTGPRFRCGAGCRGSAENSARPAAPTGAA